MPWLFVFILNFIAFSSVSFAVSSESCVDGPLYVERTEFKPETLKFFKSYQEKVYHRFEKSIQGSAKRCPKASAKIHRIVKQLLKGSNLERLNNESHQLEVIVLCSKKDMDPVARMMAGKYMLVPISLIEKSDSEASMAAVLAHELAHYTLHHHARLHEDLHVRKVPRSQINKIKSLHEQEADRIGLKILKNAGYDPRSSLTHLKKVDAMIKERVGLRKNPKTHLAFTERLSFLSHQIKNCL